MQVNLRLDQFVFMIIQLFEKNSGSPDWGTVLIEEDAVEESVVGLRGVVGASRVARPGPAFRDGARTAGCSCPCNRCTTHGHHLNHLK